MRRISCGYRSGGLLVRTERISSKKVSFGFTPSVILEFHSHPYQSRGPPCTYRNMFSAITRKIGNEARYNTSEQLFARGGCLRHAQSHAHHNVGSLICLSFPVDLRSHDHHVRSVGIVTSSHAHFFCLQPSYEITKIFTLFYVFTTAKPVPEHGGVAQLVKRGLQIALGPAIRPSQRVTNPVAFLSGAASTRPNNDNDGAGNGHDRYVYYSGPASSFPSKDTWVSFGDMFSNSSPQLLISCGNENPPQQNDRFVIFLTCIWR